MLRVLCAVAAALLSTLSFSQHSIWTHTVENSSNPQVARDASGNLYLATRGTSLNGRELKLQKFNALGTRIWHWTYLASTGGLDRQFNIKSIAVSNDRVMVVAQERDGEGEGAHQTSLAMSFLQSTGAFETSTNSTDEFVAGAFGGGRFSIVRRNASTWATSVEIRDSNFSLVTTESLGDTSHTGAVTMDSSGNSYVGWSNPSGEAQLNKISSTGTSLYSIRVDLPSRTEERIESIVHDQANDRLYVMASARWYASPFDFDVMVSVFTASSGTYVGGSSLGTSTDDEYAGELVLAKPSGVLASAKRPALSQVNVRRIGITGFTNWTHIAGSPGMGRFSLAQDADNNALHLRTVDSNTIALDRYSEAAGTVLNSYTIIGNAMEARKLFCDSAGNYYVLYHSYGDVLLRRMQPALLGGPTSARTGGTTDSAWISVIPDAVTDQVWTLSSSNSAVVAVPPTATIPNGNNVVYFTITLNPVTATTSATINARYDGFITQRQVTVIPPALNGIIVAPNTVIGGVPTSAQIFLTGLAPAGGRTVTLSSNKPAAATVPSSVVIAGGSQSTFAPVTTYGVATNQGVVISATLGAVTKTAFMAVNAPSLTSAGVSPDVIQGGTGTTLTLGLNGIAPAGGLSIVLHSGAPAIVLVPGTGAVPGGATSGNVTINTTPVTSSTNVVIFATRAGIYRVASLTVTP